MSALLIFLAVLAIARLTRLTTTDVITEPLRRKLHIAAAAGDELVWDDDVPRIVHRQGKLAAIQRFAADLTACDWCASIWWAFPVAALAWFLPPAWFIIPALALSASHLTGLLSALEYRLYDVHDHEDD